MTRWPGAISSQVRGRPVATGNSSWSLPTADFDPLSPRGPLLRFLLARCLGPISIQHSCLALVWHAVDGKVNSHRRLTQIDAEELATADCFAFPAVWFQKSSAKADIELFVRLNDARNDLYHRGVVARRLPSRDAINLFRKYLGLARGAPASEVMGRPR